MLKKMVSLYFSPMNFTKSSFPPKLKNHILYGVVFKNSSKTQLLHLDF